MVVVGYGSGPMRLINVLRERLIYNNKVYVYPEFFDSKRDLLNRNYMGYVKKLWIHRNDIIIALYPDYINKILNVPRNILYVYPVHSLDKDSEFYDQLRQYYDVIPGYASALGLRDYTIEQFCSVFSCTESWYLGANSKEIYEAIEWGFWGVDITSLTIPGWSFRDNIQHPEAIALFIEKLTQGKVLKGKHILRIMSMKNHMVISGD